MQTKEKKLISIDLQLVKFIEEDIKKIGMGCNFSGWISNAVERELRNRYGFAYTRKLQKIKDELVEQD